MVKHLRSLVRLLLAGGLLLALAWVASNAVDDAPRPPPQALAEPVLPGSDAGWRHLREMRAGLPPLDGPPAVCPGEQDCPAYWRGRRDALAAQIEPLAAFGERCAAFTALPDFAEPVPEVSLSAELAPHARPALRCATWWAATAVLAALRDDPDAARVALRGSGQLARQLLAGSRSLVGHAVAWRAAREHFQAVGAVAAERPGWAGELLPLAQPLAAGSLDPRRWMRSEAAFQHRAVQELMAAPCADHADRTWRWACTSGIGWLPQATLHLSQARWGERVELAGADPVQALPQLRTLAAPPAGAWPRWRNPIGATLVDAALPEHWVTHVARQADVDLHRVALHLALQAMALPRAERAAWLAAQPLPAALVGRLRIEDDGRLLAAQRWAQGLPGDNERLRIRYALPAPD